MFVEEKKQGEVTETPAKALKLSEAIRKGLPLVEENRGKWTQCALGAAFAGVRGRMINGQEMETWIFANEKEYHSIADALGFPRRVCEQVHNKHFYEAMPAAQIADWLEARGL